MKAKELIKLLELNPEACIKIARGALEGDTEWCTLETKYEDLCEDDVITENGQFKFGHSAEANTFWWW